MDKPFVNMINLYIFDETSRAAVFGIGSYIRELSAVLKDSKINVCIVHLRSQLPDVEHQIDENNIQHFHIPAAIIHNQSLDWNQQTQLYYQNVVFLLQLQIVDKSSLIFHLNYNQCGKLAEELKKVFDCKIITSIHFLNWCMNLSGNISRFEKILFSGETDQHDEHKKTIVNSYLIEKKFFETVDHIICLSEKTRQILEDIYMIKPEKINVIYNGLTDRVFIQNQQVLRQKYRIPDIPVILFVGRMHDIKGLTYALRAFKIVLEQRPHCHLIIVGNGTFDSYLKECENIWMNVSWTGLIEKEKLYDLYSVADMGIMPSFHEQCSYVAIEMMMHGIPLIASTTTGLKEMVNDGKTGFHIPVIEYDDSVDIDIQLFAEKMLYLLQNHDERKYMGINARKRYEMIYSAEIFRKKMLDFYNSFNI